MLVGTRPEAIKLAPVAHALRHAGITARIWLTGQHPDLDLGAYGFAVGPDLVLGCPGMSDPRRHARAVEAALAPHLAGCAMLIVQGDTSSALGGAMAAIAAGTPLAHVEAGLRSHDPQSPWPEEDFRIAIDRRASLLFAPTALAAANLRREGICGTIHVTGNTIVDALAGVVPARPAGDGRIRVLVTCHRRESWGKGLRAIAGAVRRIAARPDVHCTFVLHPNPAVAATMRIGLGDDVELVPPLDHRAMLALLAAADLALSDSGGLQEEAPLLGVPLLVLRERSERPEGIAEGVVAMAGTGRDGIVARVEALLDDPNRLAAMRRPCKPQGEPGAGRRIAALIAHSLRHGGQSEYRPPGRDAAAGW